MQHPGVTAVGYAGGLILAATSPMDSHSMYVDLDRACSPKRFRIKLEQLQQWINSPANPARAGVCVQAHHRADCSRFPPLSAACLSFFFAAHGFGWVGAGLRRRPGLSASRSRVRVQMLGAGAEGGMPVFFLRPCPMITEPCEGAIQYFFLPAL